MDALLQRTYIIGDIPVATWKEQPQSGEIPPEDIIYEVSDIVVIRAVQQKQLLLEKIRLQI